MTLARYLLGTLLLAGGAQTALGQIYRCVDPSGHSTYTNDKEGKGTSKCSVVSREVSVVPAPPAPPVATARPAAKAAGAGGTAGQSAGARSDGPAPRVEASTQRARDTDRRRILDDELRNAEKELATAKQNLVEQEAVRQGDERNYQRVLDRVKPFQDEVRRSEENVAALRREISNLR